MKFNTKLALQLLEGIEKMTGKKVVLKEWGEKDKEAYLAYKKDSAISDEDEDNLDSYEDLEELNEDGEVAPTEIKHSAGEKRAVTRGDDLSSPEQYALMYAIVTNMIYKMGTPWNNMDGKTLASQAGIKDGTFAKRARCIKNYLDGDTVDAHQLDQKGRNIVDKLKDAPKENVLKIAKNAFDPEVVQAIRDKWATKARQPVKSEPIKAPEGTTSLKGLSQERRDHFNAIRAANGRGPLPEAQILKFLNRLLEGIQKTTGKKVIFTENVKKNVNEGFDINEVREKIQAYTMKIRSATRNGDRTSMFKLRTELKSYLNNIGYQWETDPNVVEILDESKKLKEGILDFFSNDPIKKINKAIQKTIAIADDVNFYTNFYYFPDQWSGNETNEVKRRIQNIWGILSRGAGLTENKKTEKKAINEWFAKSKYNNLIKKLDEIARYADQVVAAQKKSKSPKNAQELQAMNQEILSNLKKVWQTFTKSKISDVDSFAGDDVNKLSAKQRGNKKLQVKNTNNMDNSSMVA